MRWRHSWVAVILLMMTRSVLSSESTPPADAAIARVGPYVILLREVAPNARLADAAGRNAYVQRQLDTRIRRALVDIALAKYGKSVSEQDIRNAMTDVMRDDEITHATAATNLRAATAVRRVRLGEDADRVYREELSPDALRASGIRKVSVSRQSFDALVRDLDEDALIDEFVAKGSEAAIIARYQAWAEASAKMARVKEVIRTLGESESAFWKRMLEEAHAEILIPGFRLPDFRERNAP